MKRMHAIAAGILLLGMLLTPAFGATAGEPAAATENLLPAFDIFFQTYFYAANDRDFDRTEPLYEANGQSVGYVLTTMRPGLTWRPAEILTLRYQLEVGDNLWSRNDPYGDDPYSEETAVFRHKEIWAEATTPNGRLGTRLGFQYFYDPTHLVIDRHIGLATAFYQVGGQQVTVGAGQIPDQVYEGFGEETDGLRLSANNFEQDNFLFGAWSRHPLGAGVLSPGVFFNWDKTEVDRPKGVLSVAANYHAPLGPIVKLDVDLVGQYGQYLRAGLDNRDVTMLAGAAQANVDAEWRLIGLRYNLLAFTADDGDKLDQFDTGFRYSGWSKSATLILSLNELHDQYDNVDERVAAQDAGLFLADQEFAVKPTEDVRLFLTLGAGFVLDDTNTDGESYLGTEGQFGVAWSPIQKHLTFSLIGGGLLPGEAAGQLQNAIDKTAHDPLYQGQAAMTVTY
ncbi:MAG: hypothetical protein GX444_18590 [Myxococcales bacterium]|nr:hypothetical protein [Myxococcales bacterium]